MNSKETLLKMRQILLAIIGTVMICCCTTNNDSNLDKMLFLINQYNSVHDYPYFIMKDVHYNVDSILAEKDFNVNTKGKRRILTFEYSWLDSICNDEQLIQLVNDKKNTPAVRVTAFAALVRRGYGGIEEMVLDNYKDTTSLTVWNYDCGSSEHVGSIFLRYADIGNISTKDSIKNVSLALFTKDIPVYDFLRYKMQDMQPQDERHYQRIHELFEQEPQISFLKAIARYHNPKDLEFIVQELNDYKNEGKVNINVISALAAIREWPHEHFKAGLIEFCNYIQNDKTGKSQEIPEELFDAIMAYDYSWAHPLLNKILMESCKTRDKRMIDTFHEAMIIPNDSNYIDLLKKYPSEQWTNN